MDTAMDILAQMVLYLVVARGFLALIYGGPLPWVKEPETYTLEELQTKAWCGLCGKAMEDVVPKDWPWSLCEGH